MLVITIPAVILADRIGRRVSVLTGGIILTAAMYTIGSLYASSGVHAGHGVGRWVVVVAIFVIALTYCATWAVAAKLYASEIQPARTRASANSVAQGMSFVSCPHEVVYWFENIVLTIAYSSSATGSSLSPHQSFLQSQIVGFTSSSALSPSLP